MLRLLSKLSKIAAAALLSSIALPVLAQVPASTGLMSTACRSNIPLPTAIDWNQAFPITIGFVGTIPGPGGATNPPEMRMPARCVCPNGLLSSTIGGIGLTFWLPTTLMEANRSGCISAAGGLTLPFLELAGTQYSKDAGGNHDQIHRPQTISFEYPILGQLDLFKSITCLGYSLDALKPKIQDASMVDPSALSDFIAKLESPESVLFATPLAVLACAADAVIAGAGTCYNSLFWCAGTWGADGPISNNGTSATSVRVTNHFTMFKALRRAHHRFILFNSIGPLAVCGPYPSPVHTKCQYRYNQVGPWPQMGRSIYAGTPGEIGLVPPVSNAPTYDFTQVLLWQGIQCCASQ